MRAFNSDLLQSREEEKMRNTLNTIYHVQRQSILKHIDGFILNYKHFFDVELYENMFYVVFLQTSIVICLLSQRHTFASESHAKLGIFFVINLVINNKNQSMMSEVMVIYIYRDLICTLRLKLRKAVIFKSTFQL